jgi:AraC-like DNA-binding protein
MAQVRAAALINYFEVARFVGIDPLAMLKRARINPAILEQPDARISRRSANLLLNESARAANCIAFGLMMAESRSLSQLGAISLLLRHQETVRGVVEALGRYRHLIGDTIDMSVEDRGDDVALGVHIVTGSGSIERQGIELAMGILCRAIVAASRGRWQPQAVHFMHPAPGDMAVHRRVFGAPLVFDSDFNGFISTRAAIDAPFSTTDAEMARYAETYLDQLPSDTASASPAERVRRALDLMMPLGRATLEQVSENIGMPPRTLQRLLDKEGQSFASLLNAARRETAVDRLEHTNASLGEIARVVGYATPSSFTRWFFAEFGTTPGAWRAGERAA